MLLESGDYFTSALLDELLTFLHDVGRHYIVQVFGWNLDLDPFNTVAADDSYTVLRGLLLICLGLVRVFKTNKPLDL